MGFYSNALGLGFDYSLGGLGGASGLTATQTNNNPTDQLKQVSLEEQAYKDSQNLKHNTYVIHEKFYPGSMFPITWGTTASYPDPYTPATQIPGTGVTDGVPNYFLLALSVLKNNLIKSLQAKGNETYRNWVEKTVANEVDIITQQLKGDKV